MHRPVVGLLVTLLFASLVSAGTEPKEVSFTAADAARPDGEMEVESVREQLEDFAARGFRTFVAIDGVHGSSMLHPERAEGEVEAIWEAVLELLAGP